MPMSLSRRATRRATRLLSLTTAVAAVALSTTAAANAMNPFDASSFAAAPSSTSALVQPWAYQAAMGRQITYTTAQATAQAQQFNVIAAVDHGYTADAVTAMYRANPNLQLLAYVNGAYAQSTQGTAYPSSWYLKTASGVQVRSKAYGNYLMDVDNPAWVADVANRCQTIMASNNYNGCFIDMMGTASIMDGYTNGVPINPETGTPYSDTTWLAQTAALSASVKTALGGNAPVLANGLGSGQRYSAATAPSKVIMSGIDGGMAETWLRPAPNALSWYPTEANWLKNVDMLTTAAASGKTVLLTTKTWGSGTAAQRDAWHVFAVASYLMTADGRAQFSFLPTSTSDPAAVDTLISGLDLGDAQGAYSKVGTAYQRVFARGRVLVNPTTTATTVPVTGTFVDQSGAVVSGGTVTLPADSAKILTSR